MASENLPAPLVTFDEADDVHARALQTELYPPDAGEQADHIERPHRGLQAWTAASWIFRSS
jgi:hypothetical protein